MKVLVTGVCGQLGYDTVIELKKRGHEAIGTDISDSCELDCGYIKLDITDKNAVYSAIENSAPDAVIHCAAWTAVDAAEDEENKPKVRMVNVDGTRNIAEACKNTNSKMIYISTDYVFNGNGDTPWKADCEDFEPLNYYGKSKREGELAVKENLKKFYIVRTSWVFGKGTNFIRTMLGLSEKYSEIRVVNDQIGTPTYTSDLSRLLADMAETEKYGVYHASNEGGYISWAEFAEEIFRQAKKNTAVTRVTTEEYGISKAKRPFNSRLDKSKLTENGFALLPDWKDALTRYLEEIHGTDQG